MGQVASVPTMQLSNSFPNFGSSRLLQRSKQSDQQKLPIKEEMEIVTDEARLQFVGAQSGLEGHIVDTMISCTITAATNENVLSALSNSGAIDELVTLMVSTPREALLRGPATNLALEDDQQNKSSYLEKHLLTATTNLCSKCSNKMSRSDFAKVDHGLNEAVDEDFSRGSIGKVPSNVWAPFKDLLHREFFLPLVSVFVVGTVVYCRGFPELAIPWLRVAFKHFLGVFQNLVEVAKATARELWTVGGVFKAPLQHD